MAIPGYPNLSAAPGADWKDLSSGLLGGLQRMLAALGLHGVITSGYRTPAQSIAVGGSANDPHTRHIAADVTVNGRPIGDVVPRWQFARYGLATGNVAGFWPGHDAAYPHSPNDPPGSDPVHVQLSGSTMTAKSYAHQGTEIQRIIQAAVDVGVDPIVAVATALEEGGGRILPATQVNRDASGKGIDYGPFQLNTTGEAAGHSKAELQDAYTNARIALSAFASWMRAHPGVTDAGQIAAGAQRPTNPSSYAAGVDAYVQRASALVRAALPPGGITPSTGNPAPPQEPGSAADAGSYDLGDLGHAIASPLEELQRFLRFLLSVRFLEIVGGGALVLVGLFLVSRNTSAVRS